ncbi:hypothetical protein G6F62_003083 [Rhizopus arrhizus]|nr:hypothetical protein G6F66_001475 [Rhizopus arrhizus]KAG1351078.1 hypothetical protein G6F62_003083 [Rhizopus arrhizus]KAG1375407.1 hypothetical protein G6F61_008502 [Rhizopus arrhizus]KAG1407509.1 hypothetical protein G6F60_002142 [Rhizopus arrhizus]
MVIEDLKALLEIKTNPGLAPTAQHDPAQFSAMLQQIRQSRRTAKIQKVQLAALNDNSFDVGAHRRIEEAI